MEARWTNAGRLDDEDKNSVGRHITGNAEAEKPR